MLSETVTVQDVEQALLQAARVNANAARDEHDGEAAEHFANAASECVMAYKQLNS